MKNTSDEIDTPYYDLILLRLRSFGYSLCNRIVVTQSLCNRSFWRRFRWQLIVQFSIGIGAFVKGLNQISSFALWTLSQSKCFKRLKWANRIIPYEAEAKWDVNEPKITISIRRFNTRSCSENAINQLKSTEELSNLPSDIHCPPVVTLAMSLKLILMPLAYTMVKSSAPVE